MLNIYGPNRVFDYVIDIVDPTFVIEVDLKSWSIQAAYADFATDVAIAPILNFSSEKLSSANVSESFSITDVDTYIKVNSYKYNKVELQFSSEVSGKLVLQLQANKM